MAATSNNTAEVKATWAPSRNRTENVSFARPEPRAAAARKASTCDAAAKAPKRVLRTASPAAAKAHTIELPDRGRQIAVPSNVSPRPKAEYTFKLRDCSPLIGRTKETQ